MTPESAFWHASTNTPIPELIGHSPVRVTHTDTTPPPPFDITAYWLRLVQSVRVSHRIHYTIALVEQGSTPENAYNWACIHYPRHVQ